MATGLWGLSTEPVFEARLAELSAVAWNEFSPGHLDAVVARVRVRDNFAWVLASSQIPADGFVQTKLFGAAYFHHAIRR